MPKFQPPIIGDEFNFEGDTIIYFPDSLGKCCVCGEQTHFVSLSFEAYHCSEECNRKTWKELSQHAENKRKARK